MENPSPQSPEPAERYRIVLDSIGQAGASMVGALKAMSPLPDTRLAELLMQAPSVLVGGLSYEVAGQVCQILNEGGLETRVSPEQEAIEPGDSLHELAIVVQDWSKAMDILHALSALLGIPADQARKLLCTAPTSIIGRISARTANTLRARFEALGAEVDVIRADQELYDLFVGECLPLERESLARTAAQLGAHIPPQGDDTLVAVGLSRAQADYLWSRFGNGHMPIRVIARSLERYDLTLESAPDTPEMRALLMELAGMPEAVVPKVLQRMPITLQQSLRFEPMTQAIAAIAELGGVALGRMMTFRSFSLEIISVGDRRGTQLVLQAIGGLDEATAIAAMDSRKLEGPFSPPQSAWLQQELKRVRTETRRFLR